MLENTTNLYSVRPATQGVDPVGFNSASNHRNRLHSALKEANSMKVGTNSVKSETEDTLKKAKNFFMSSNYTEPNQEPKKPEDRGRSNTINPNPHHAFARAQTAAPGNRNNLTKEQDSFTKKLIENKETFKNI